MPKIIENVSEKLIREARRQIEEAGYANLTIRSVATACGVGVGTVYNYFPSKEALVASYMLEDWKLCVDAINACAEEATDKEPVLQAIYDNLTGFISRHQTIFRDEGAAQSFSGSFSRYHALLRRQLAAPLRKFCPDDFTAEFIAEAILTWTAGGKSFDELSSVLKRLF